jgi:hypothetical protein
MVFLQAESWENGNKYGIIFFSGVTKINTRYASRYFVCVVRVVSPTPSNTLLDPQNKCSASCNARSRQTFFRRYNRFGGIRKLSNINCIHPTHPFVLWHVKYPWPWPFYHFRSPRGPNRSADVLQLI